MREGKSMGKSASPVAKLAIALAIVGGILALVNVVVNFSNTGNLEYGKIALAFGVPALFYGILRSQK
jgi:hypothetical protein